MAQKSKYQLHQSLYWISIVSFAVVVMWIGFEVFWSYNDSGDVSVKQTLLTPIDTEVYLDLADSLQTREVVSQETLDEFLENVPNQRPLVELPEASQSASSSSQTR